MLSGSEEEKDNPHNLVQAFAALLKSGFYPEKKGILAFRGDSRKPGEIKAAGGFKPHEPSQPPGFCIHGGSINLVAATTNINTAIGQPTAPKKSTHRWLHIQI